MEGPDQEGAEGGDSKRVGSGIGGWMRGQLSRAPSVSSMSYKRSDLRLLLGVMGAPLAPVYVCAADPLPHLSIKDTPIVSSLSFFACPFAQFSILDHRKKKRENLERGFRCFFVFGVSLLSECFSE